MATYRIKPIIVGVKTRYQIQKRTFMFLWSTVMNPIVSPPSPFEFKIKGDAKKKLTELQSVS